MDGKVLVYDGDCPICIRGSRGFVRLGFLPEERRWEFQALEPGLAGRLAAAGFRNEMAVVEPASGELRTGIPGFLWLLRDGWLGPVARGLDRRGPREALAAVYHLVSYNRRILAPPRSPIRCACDPDDRPGYQLALLVLLLAFALGAAALFGAAVAGARGAFAGAAAAGGLWSALALGAAAFPPQAHLRYLAHAGMVVAAGAAALLPAALLAPLLPPPLLRAAAVVAVAASLAVMARQLLRRLRYLGLPPGRPA
ncbi:MAG TPA: hypothetical protein VF121_18830 [Thermoanaerobaculia bacterium]|nr:hypothetical protein [Thermoanaerobaculia bacterium]